MIRITKLTDYGILVLTLMSDLPEGTRVSARDLAAETYLPQTTVAKILQLLTRAGLLTSQRGVTGGYSLARPSETISVMEVIQAFEGPIALTDCLSVDAPTCEVESVCTTRANWGRINGAIRTALEEIPLSEMARPQTGWRQRISDSLAPEGEQVGKA
ncbi:MAG: SUF system Fe-S cluster assembly regulator [Planctomycetota bacterium]|nr:SUF system Fe-S cluster assembly regulator [Planctomycetota bacterium]